MAQWPVYEAGRGTCCNPRNNCHVTTPVLRAEFFGSVSTNASKVNDGLRRTQQIWRSRREDKTEREQEQNPEAGNAREGTPSQRGRIGGSRKDGAWRDQGDRYVYYRHHTASDCALNSDRTRSLPLDIPEALLRTFAVGKFPFPTIASVCLGQVHVASRHRRRYRTPGQPMRPKLGNTGVPTGRFKVAVTPSLQS